MNKTIQPATAIDFGVGKIRIEAEANSSILIAELTETLQQLAMVVPLQTIVTALKRLK